MPDSEMFQHGLNRPKNHRLIVNVLMRIRVRQRQSCGTTSLNLSADLCTANRWNLVLLRRFLFVDVSHLGIRAPPTLQAVEIGQIFQFNRVENFRNLS